MLEQAVSVFDQPDLMNIILKFHQDNLDLSNSQDLLKYVNELRSISMVSKNLRIGVRRFVESHLLKEVLKTHKIRINKIGDNDRLFVPISEEIHFVDSLGKHQWKFLQVYVEFGLHMGKIESENEALKGKLQRAIDYFLNIENKDELLKNPLIRSLLAVLYFRNREFAEALRYCSFWEQVKQNIPWVTEESLLLCIKIHNSNGSEFTAPFDDLHTIGEILSRAVIYKIDQENRQENKESVDKLQQHIYRKFTVWENDDLLYNHVNLMEGILFLLHLFKLVGYFWYDWMSSNDFLYLLSIPQMRAILKNFDKYVIYVFDLYCKNGFGGDIFEISEYNFSRLLFHFNSILSSSISPRERFYKILTHFSSSGLDNFLIKELDDELYLKEELGIIGKIFNIVDIEKLDLILTCLKYIFNCYKEFTTSSPIVMNFINNLLKVDSSYSLYQCTDNQIQDYINFMYETEIAFNKGFKVIDNNKLSIIKTNKLVSREYKDKFLMFLILDLEFDSKSIEKIITNPDQCLLKMYANYLTSPHKDLPILLKDIKLLRTLNLFNSNFSLLKKIIERHLNFLPKKEADNKDELFQKLNKCTYNEMIIAFIDIYINKLEAISTKSNIVNSGFFNPEIAQSNKRKAEDAETEETEEDSLMLQPTATMDE